MLTRTFSAAVQGIEAYTVDVEVNATGQGESTYVPIVGLPDNAVRESRERVRSALANCGFFHPEGTTVINLAPADVKKEGAAFDLPIALGLIAATGGLDREKLARTMTVGELALDGGVRPVRGALPIAAHARTDKRIEAILVPTANANEAAIASGGIPVYAVGSLSEAVGYFNGEPLPRAESDIAEAVATEPIPDFSEVKGQAMAKRAMEIVAAGSHNCLFLGPPGTGKSMLAQRLPGILPPMNMDETLETSKIHSILGLLSTGRPLLNTRPFRSPHHTISDAGLIGGGQNPVPGEISLSHNGVLFLDELPEFKRNVLEVLRQPLENGSVTVSRAAGSFTFPSKFILVAAMNPCPCGLSGGRMGCRCTSTQVQRYRSRISGPLLDRIDIHIELPPLTENELVSAPSGESSESIRARVLAARKIQEERFRDGGIFCNSQMGTSHLADFCRLDKKSETLLRHSIREMGLSARAYDRILRVARTIADLEKSTPVTEEHIYESVNYRSLDKKIW